MLSVLICAKNEADNLKGCLEFVAFADEVVVVDDFSTDGSYELASELGAKVFRRSLSGDFASQRNFGIEKCSGDWILVVDADERVGEELARSIKEKTMVGATPACYSIRRQARFHHHSATHGVLGTDWVVRLAPKKGLKYVGLVHERMESPYPEAKGLDGEMYHYTYDNWDAYFVKFNTYTSLLATQKYEAGRKASFIFDIMIRPWFAFLKMYVLKGGFLDGKLGFILSVNHFFYVMTKYVKLYYLNDSQGKL